MAMLGYREERKTKTELGDTGTVMCLVGRHENCEQGLQIQYGMRRNSGLMNGYSQKVCITGRRRLPVFREEGCG